MLIIKGFFGKGLKRCVFKVGVFSFSVTSILMFAIPSNSQNEPIGTVQQPYGVYEPVLTKNVKSPIYVDICGPGLPASPTDRQTLQNYFQNAVLAWIEPMRIFGAPLTREIHVGICGSDKRMITIITKECSDPPNDDEPRLPVIKPKACGTVRKKEEDPPDLKVVIETILPDNRSRTDIPGRTIQFLANDGYNVALHEVGHAFGLLDTYAEGGFFCDIYHSQFAPAASSVMCNANFPSLQPDDIAGIQHLYCVGFPEDCTRGVLTVEHDYDRPGQDYANFDLSSASYRLCYDKCATDGNCKAYTYVPPGVQGPNARCWLKNSIPDKATRTGMTSGYKP